jgi:hypothetical protein
MRHDHDMLVRLAEVRRRNMAPDGRPVIGTTREQAERSTLTAMRLADAPRGP